MTVSGRAAVLGSPIVHSLSPTLHRAAYAALGLDWTYDAIDVPKADFERVLEQLCSAPEFVGVSVTMPLKELALAAAADATEVAVRTQAANTLVVKDGGLHADNTDPVGILWALERAGVVGDVQRGGIIGAGATSRSALAAFAQLGTSTVDVVARRPEAIAALTAVAHEFGISVEPHNWDEYQPVLNQPVVISTVPAGVCDAFAHNVPQVPGVLLDVVYAPWPTALALRWGSAGGVVVSGLEMLVGQAGRQIEIMTGRHAPLDAMMDAATAARQTAG